MKYKAFRKMFSGKFFTKDGHKEDFLCIGEDGRIYEQVDFNTFLPVQHPIYEEDGSTVDAQNVLEMAEVDGWD